MFDIFCPKHDSQVLLSNGNIDSFRNTDKGIEISYHCNCGHSGVLVTGRAAAV